MNRVYPVLFIIVFLVVNVPRSAFAQCNCSPGVPATPITYYSGFPSTNAATTTFNFPQFDPSVGTLACLTLNDTVTGITTTSALNKASNPVTYKFQLTVADDLEGPSGGGISITNTYNRIYGPDTLARLGFPGDTITYGPDTVIDNEVGFATTSSNTGPYLGTGTVDFTYSLNGGVIALQGGLNYQAGPTTNYYGNFQLTYYWCPAVNLSTTIYDFTAAPQGTTVLLQWLTSNQQPNTEYEIQTSPDGKDFYTVGQAESDASSAGAAGRYQYQFNPDPSYVGQIYFRIKETDPSGAITYSTVILVNPKDGATGTPSYQTFPNPATNSLQVQFSSGQTGQFLVEMVSTSGQIVQQKTVTLAGSAQIMLDLSPQPAKGLYFLKTTDITHNRSYVTKVFVD